MLEYWDWFWQKPSNTWEGYVQGYQPLLINISIYHLLQSVLQYSIILSIRHPCFLSTSNRVFWGSGVGIFLGIWPEFCIKCQGSLVHHTGVCSFFFFCDITADKWKPQSGFNATDVQGHFLRIFSEHQERCSCGTMVSSLLYTQSDNFWVEFLSSAHETHLLNQFLMPVHSMMSFSVLKITLPTLSSLKTIIFKTFLNYLNLFPALSIADSPISSS